MNGIELAKELLARPQRNATDWAAARCIEAQAALIKELVEELDAVRIIAAQAHRNYGNIGKETTFLLTIEERAAAALAKAVQP
jgi:hypothetical protein